MWHTGWAGGEWIFMAAAMLMFWTAVVTGALMISAKRRPHDESLPVPREPGGTEIFRGDARSILDARLARGDMTPEEYQVRRDMLTTR